MRTLIPTRGLILWAILLGSYSWVSGVAYGQRGSRPAPVVRQAPSPRPMMRQRGAAPIERRAPAPVTQAAPRPQTRVAGPAIGPGVPKGHLGEWMNQHSSLPPAQQQQALEREPGFRQLPPQQQQNMRQRLAQLDAMPTQQRQRMLAHNEAMERLSPDQRQQVRGVMSQLGSLPQDQRQSVARSFRELRELPPEQRAAAMNSGRYSNLNESQRATLNNLMRVEPMLPPPEPQQPR